MKLPLLMYRGPSLRSPTWSAWYRRDGQSWLASQSGYNEAYWIDLLVETDAPLSVGRQEGASQADVRAYYHDRRLYVAETEAYYHSADIRIYTMLGEQVQHSVLHFDSNLVFLPLTSLHPGKYVVSVTTRPAHPQAPARKLAFTFIIP